MDKCKHCEKPVGPSGVFLYNSPAGPVRVHKGCLKAYNNGEEPRTDEKPPQDGKPAL